MKYGTVLSGGKKIIPLGDSIAYMFMLDDWRKGNFWSRKKSDKGDVNALIYTTPRTYKQQIEDAVAEGAKEMIFTIDDPIGTFIGLDTMVQSIYKTVKGSGYEEEIIFSPQNEPLERTSTTGYISIANMLSGVVRELSGASLSIGGMASEFTGFYEQIASQVSDYKYIDFHTSNDGNLWSVDHLIRTLPEDKPLICSEHYQWNEAQENGYDDKDTVQHFKQVTDYYFKNPRIKSVYCCLPSGIPEGNKYAAVLLRHVDKDSNIVHETEAWYMLKLYDKGGETVAKLKVLKEGDKGYDVLALQDMLTAAKCDPKGIDGIFGPNTTKAVNKYRKAHGFIENGLCSYPVWYYLSLGEETSDLIDAYFRTLEMM